MKKQLLIIVSLVISIFISVNGYALVGDPKAGKGKSMVCSACHGANGNSVVGIWPKIAGQHENYMINQIMELQKGTKGKRHDPTMYPMIQRLSEQDIADLSAFYASQEISSTAKPIDQSVLSLGKKLYMSGDVDSGIPACASCHGPTGAGNALANFPKLSKQHADYIVTQMKKYRAGERSTDPKEIMRDISKRMTEEKMKAVSHYIANLQ